MSALDVLLEEQRKRQRDMATSITTNYSLYNNAAAELAHLRAEHLVALKANTDVAGMNVSLQIEIISLRAELADMQEQMEVMKGAKEIIARLRAELDETIKANVEVARMNIDLQAENIQLRAELETEKAGAILLENELNRQLTKKDAELDELEEKASLVDLVDGHFRINFDKMREDNDELRAYLSAAERQLEREREVGWQLRARNGQLRSEILEDGKIISQWQAAANNAIEKVDKWKHDLETVQAQLDAKNAVIKEILEAAKDNGLPNFRKAIEDTLAAKKVIEQVKHDGDIFDHLRGFAGYIKASAHLAAHPEEEK